MASLSDGPGAGVRPRAEGGVVLAAVGAVLLLVSLFLDWYQPGRSAWTVFEVWDLVLAALSLMALVAAAGRLGFGRSRPDSWLVAPSVVTLVIVVASLINHPPAAVGANPMIGIWLALIAAVLMVAGVGVSVAGVSVAIKIEGSAADTNSGGSPAVTGRAGRSASGLGLRRDARGAPGTEAPSAGASSAPAGEAGTEATRVLEDDPGIRREPPAPPR